MKKYSNVGQMCGSSGHESCKSQFDQLPLHEWEESRSGGAYDIGSVMHYGMSGKYLITVEHTVFKFSSNANEQFTVLVILEFFLIGTQVIQINSFDDNG